jgi:cation diffusion facilitator CzcD-associated flavoprotein CzcO
VYETGWELGGPDFTLGGFADAMVNEESNAMVADFVRGKIDEIVADPEVAKMLKPTGFPFGSKRLPMDTDYYATFNRENVTLVDLKRTPIAEVTPRGLRTTETDHELDIIIFATGFDAMTGPLLALDIRGRGGRRLAESWADGPRTYLGLAIPGFPNLFTITGPGSPSVLVNMPVSIEQHVEWIADCLVAMRADDGSLIEPTEEATDEWTTHVQEAAEMTLFPQADSWYMGANIPGKPRRFLPYVGGLVNYEAKTTAVAAGGYEGFVISAPRPA